MANRAHSRIVNPTLIIVGFGYFIDAFDLFLYNALRVPSLREIGLSGDVATKVGLQILSLQLTGMFLGGYVWGIIGDKIGRKNALIWTVLLYSLGSLGSALAWNVPFYAAMRFMTGLGVAGETGLGAILVAETLPDQKRSMAVMAFALFGVTAIFSANAIAEFVPWRACYAIGGILGLVLLLARRRLRESSLFEVLPVKIQRGSFRLLLQRKDLLLRYVATVLFALPNFYMANFLLTLAPEFGKAVGAEVPIKTNIALMAFFAGQFVSDIVAVLISILLRSRKAAVTIYTLASVAMAVVYITLDHPTEMKFYVICGMMGLTSYWVLLFFTAVEQFGTNMRATLGVSALSTGRAMLVIVSMAFLALRNAGVDMVKALEIETSIIFILSLICLFGLRETYRASVDFLEDKPQ